MYNPTLQFHVKELISGDVVFDIGDSVLLADSYQRTMFDRSNSSSSSRQRWLSITVDLDGTAFVRTASIGQVLRSPINADQQIDANLNFLGRMYVPHGRTYVNIESTYPIFFSTVFSQVSASHAAILACGPGSHISAGTRSVVYAVDPAVLTVGPGSLVRLPGGGRVQVVQFGKTLYTMDGPGLWLCREVPVENPSPAMLATIPFPQNTGYDTDGVRTATRTAPPPF